MFSDMSENKAMMATTQAPIAKKKSIKLGAANSRRKNRKPIMNQMTGVVKNVFIVMTR
jgi:hypothetical protein